MGSNVAEQTTSQESKDQALHYFKTLVEVARESFLILDSDLRVITANPVFYQIFQVIPERTENKLLWELGNGQWDIPDLKSLLEKVLPDRKVVKDYVVSHLFETIGQKTMLLNAKQIDTVQLIVLAIEDITARKDLESKLAVTIKDLAAKVEERTKELTERIKELELVNKSMVGRELKMVELKNEVERLKKLTKNGNGNHKNAQ